MFWNIAIPVITWFVGLAAGAYLRGYFGEAGKVKYQKDLTAKPDADKAKILDYLWEHCKARKSNYLSTSEINETLFKGKKDLDYLYTLLSELAQAGKVDKSTHLGTVYPDGVDWYIVV